MRQTVAGLAAVACCLPLCWLSGCGWQQHGVLIRGGCSLEINRLPWRTGVPVECDQEGCGGCEGEGCGVGGGCTPGTVKAEPVGPPPVSDQAGYCRPPGLLSWLFAGLLGDGGSFYGCPSCQGCQGCQGCSEGCVGEAVVETGPIHSRFHPVPTRPVFLAPPQPSRPIPGGPFPEGPVYLSATNRASATPRRVPPPNLEIQVPEPPPEAYPVAPLPPRDREVRAPRPENTASSGRSWVFAAGDAERGWHTARARAMAERDAKGRMRR